MPHVLSVLFSGVEFWSFPVMHIISVKIIGIYLKAESAEFGGEIKRCGEQFSAEDINNYYDN